MGYPSKGRKPAERASKISHVEILRNPEVIDYVGRCALPSEPAPGALDASLADLESADTSEVKAIIAIDGGYTEAPIREGHPSSAITFFTFGPLLFRLADLRALDRQHFIAPGDVHKLKQIERYTLVLPTRGIRDRGEPTLSATIRRAIYGFFLRDLQPGCLMDGLRWLLFRRWKRPLDESASIEIAHCPSGCGCGPIAFAFGDPTHTACPSCHRPVYLTDSFRLHERIDEEMGASGISSYVMTMLEQIVLVQLVYQILGLKPALLREFLFIKDGPLAFFGLVSPLCRPMRELAHHLLSQGPSGPTLRVAGLEKSGAFVEHASAIQNRIGPGQLFVVGDRYIRRYVVPNNDSSTIFGESTYWGQKVLFRARSGEMYVATIPAERYLAEPSAADIPHLHEILSLIGELRCSMYDNALIPVALANKLVSLSHFPSQRILAAFARKGLGA